MGDIAPSTVEGMISKFAPQLCALMLDSHNGVDVRLAWDRVRGKLMNMENFSKPWAQDVRYALKRTLEDAVEKVPLLDVRIAVSEVIHEINLDMMRAGPYEKRGISEILEVEGLD